MAGELEFSALHSDDRLLDALASRGEIAVDDPVATLLAAFAADVDARPVPLADALAGGLLSRPLASARTETAAVSAGAASAAFAGQTDVLIHEPEPDGAAPPVAVSLAGRRRWHTMLPRAAATAGVAAVVLGAGGVAAAVGGGGSLTDGIRQVVGNVIRPVAPTPSREDKVSRLLDQASAALKTQDATKAHHLLVQAKSQLNGLESSVAKTLQEKLATLQSKLEHLRQSLPAAVPASGTDVDATAGRSAGHPEAKHPAAHPSATPTNSAPSGSSIAPRGSVPLGTSPEDAAESPAEARADGITQELKGAPDLGNPADTLPGTQKLPGEAKISEAEREVQEKAEQVPVPGPDEVDTPVGPVHPLRTPSAVDVFDDPSVRHVVVDAAPTAGSAANGVTGGGNP